MWVITNRGLLSIVQDRDDPGRALVRARQRGLLEAVLSDPSVVFTDSHADYPYRAFISREELRALLAREADRIDYPNFKDSIPDGKLHDKCMKVWSILRDLDER